MPSMPVKRNKWCLGIAFFLVACTEQPGADLPLLTGTQEVSGYLVPAELSLVRRGTHLLMNKGIEQYFVESKMSALRAFEGKEVTIRGTLEANADGTSLPVLIVEEIMTNEAPWKKISLAFMGIALEIPSEWRMEDLGQEILFIPASSNKAIVRIAREEGALSVSGSPLRVGGRRAVRIMDEESGEQRIMVTEMLPPISIVFTPHEPEHLFEERTSFLRLLNSLEWLTAAATQSRSSLSSFDHGAPCGGPAGVLCPKGFYCEIKDFKEGIGKCVKI